MSYEVEVRTLPREDTAAITVTCPWQEIGAHMPALFGEVMACLGPLGAIRPDAKAFARYTPTGDQVTVEAGFTVAGPIPGAGRVHPGELPGGEAAVTMHVGPYDQVEAAYRALQEWLKANGREGTQVTWEYYLSPPGEVPPRTLVVWPLVPVGAHEYAISAI